MTFTARRPTIEGDPALAAVFQAAGADVLHEILQLRAELR